MPSVQTPPGTDTGRGIERGAERGVERATEPRTDARTVRPSRRDFVLVICLVAAAVIEGMLRPDLSWAAATTILTVVLIAGLPWRRSHPLPVVIATTLLTTGFVLAQSIAGVAPSGLLTMFALLLVPYALFRWGSARARLMGAAILAVGVVISTILGGERGIEAIVGAVAGVLFVGSACLLGALRRERSRARERELSIARSRERETLARDLHDTVAHHVSAIAIRAQAARVSPDDAGAVTESLDIIEHEARAVLAEMRALVRTLRMPADYTPSHSLPQIAALAAPGPPRVSVRTDVPDPLPDVIAATFYRIAQEAITNARRHAKDATSIDVVLQTVDRRAQLIVVNDGAVARNASKDGFGLRGMAERAALLGGSVEAGPRAEGGWMLTATIPLDAAS